MNLLSRKEEIILLSIHRLGNKAYGIKIRDDIEEVSGVAWPLGSLYTPISNLDKKGLIIAKKGDATAIRGGKAKIFFKLTGEGITALKNIKILHENLWENILPLKVD